MDLTSTLNRFKDFVDEEHTLSFAKLQETWEKPLQEKLYKGETQEIISLERIDNNHLLAVLGENDSRFREGDMLCLHLGDASIERHIQGVVIEEEQEGSWLLRVQQLDNKVISKIDQGCYADPDGMNLKPFYEKALDEIAGSSFGLKIILPLLSGQLDTDFIYEDNYDDAADYAEERGLNEQQSDAVGKGVAAKYLACIQGPPGTGKTKVISIIAKLLVESGQRVLVTSHTHMAINNALNKIAEENIPVVKICASGGTKALSNKVKHYGYADKWEDRPDSMYVIGATPFATCSDRLEQYYFDTIIFDEASQITLPLALMAMRKGKRFVFVGDHKQLPPVVLSASILDDYSAFSRMISGNESVSVLLNKTYRMSKDLTSWPSSTYYNQELISERAPENSVFKLKREPKLYKEILSENNPFVFIKTPSINSRSFNIEEAKLVSEIVSSAIDAGMNATDIGIVTPYRNHVKKLKSFLQDKIGMFNSGQIVTDTVERMQGQERDMIIVSLCSSDQQFISAIASFFFQAERLNVAITRPQTKLIVIGPDIPKNFLSEKDDDLLHKNINDYRSLIKSSYYVG